ncbi:signal peptidase I [Enterococcus sp. AZ163]|uniref:signal peptidase I n=1 Tax=Enterococcus sp. AZ163 TaxID=2774638 RepID=UPI003D2B6254
MSRPRDYRDREYHFDEEPPYREHPPSNRRPDRRDSYEDRRYRDSVRESVPRPKSNRGERDYSPRYRESVSRERYGQRYPPDPQYREQHRPKRPMRPVAPPYRNSQPLQQAKKSTNRKIFLFIYNLFFYTLTIGILLSSLMFAFSEKSDAAIFGYRFYQVLTDSMAPQPDSPSKGFYSGDIVLVKMADGSQVKEGDIVTFQVGEGDRYLTHRMIERLEELNGKPGDYIVTKGDANNTADPPIEASRIYGKVTFVIPKMGSVLNFVQENLWLCLVCILSTFGFFLVLKAYFLQPESVNNSSKRNGYPKRI